MGCCASAQAECSPTQKEELCCNMGKEMLKICVPLALAKSDQVVVQPPKEINQLREKAAELRRQAEQAKQAPSAPGEANAAADAGASGGGGLMGAAMGVLSAGTAAVTAVAQQGADVMRSGIAAGLTLVADALDKAVAQIEKPMSEVGKTIVDAKKAEIEAVLIQYIDSLNLQNGIKLVRGDAPYGEAQYKAVPGGALSTFLAESSAGALEAKLKEVVEPAVKGSAAMKAWADAIGSYNSAIAKMEEFKLSSKPEPIQLDLCDYIVAQTVVGLGKVMGGEETVIRAAPAGKSRYPQTFATVFSGNLLTNEVYANRTK